MMRLLVLNDHEGELGRAPAMARLRAMAEVEILDRPLTEADWPRLADVQVLLALRERTQIDRAFLAACPALELILQTGGHAYHLDQAAATAQGVIVALGRRTKMPMVVVPELVFGLLLGLVRQIYPLHQGMAAGEWPHLIGGSLHGKTIGLLGYGRHGRPIARLAEAFGMQVVAWDRTGAGPAVDEFGVRRLPLDELLATADVVSVHLRLSEESRGMLRGEHFARMKDGAIFVNTARGAIVDEAALVEALRRGKLAGAGLDVFAHEPLAADSPLRQLPNVLLTPHVGWQVSAVLHEFVAIAAAQLEAWLAGQLNPAEVLNPAALAVARPRHGRLKTIE
ncbi:MAG: hypothetical protein KDE34_20255 [Anaerolineales bacterium]|nr:hypothetical protein [Anaerolineales bacterium]